MLGVGFVFFFLFFVSFLRFLEHWSPVNSSELLRMLLYLVRGLAVSLIPSTDHCRLRIYEREKWGTDGDTRCTESFYQNMEI